MALNLANLPKFIKTTVEKYNALQTKDENALYFLTDATQHHIYLGSHQYSFNVVVSESDPTENGVTGTIYYNSATGVATIFDGTAFRTLGVAKSSNISEVASDDGTVPTSFAAKTYADSAAAAAAAPKVDKLTNATAGDIITAGANGAIADSGKTIGGATLAATPSADTVASEAAVKAYADSAAATAASPKLDKLSSATNGNILTAASAGAAVADSGKSIGGNTITVTEGAASADVVATEAAVKAYGDAAEAAAKTYADNLISGLGSVMEFKSSVADMAALNAITGQEKGDVYHVIAGANGAAAEYVWDGTAWEELGTTIDMSGYMQKVASATASDLAALNANGEVVDSGKSVGGATLAASPTANVVATEAAVKAYADSVGQTLGDDKLDKFTATTGNVVLAHDNGGALFDSGMQPGTATFAATPNAQTLATEEGAAAYADDAAADAAAPKLDKLNGATNGNILTVASTGEAVADSGKAIGGATFAASPDANTVATEAGAKAYADGKIAKVASATTGNLVKLTADGQLEDAGASLGGSTIGATPSATVVVNEAAVEAYVQAALNNIAWQTL